MKRIEVHSHQQNLCFFVTAVDLLFSVLFGDDWHSRRIRKGFICELEQIMNGTIPTGFQGRILPANWPKTSWISFRASTDFLAFHDVQVFAQEVHPYLDFAIFDVSCYSSSEIMIGFKRDLSLGSDDSLSLAYLEGQCFIVTANSLRVVRADQEVDKRLLDQKIATFPVDPSFKIFCNVLKIETLRDLVQKTDEELQECHGFKRHSLERTKTILVAYGLKLGMKFPAGS